MTPLLLTAISAAPTLIRLAEQLIKKPQAGEERMDVVLQGLRALLGKIAATENIPSQPSDELLTGVIEAALAQEKAKGTLGAVEEKYFIVRGAIAPLEIKF